MFRFMQGRNIVSMNVRQRWRSNSVSVVWVMEEFSTEHVGHNCVSCSLVFVKSVFYKCIFKREMFSCRLRVGSCFSDLYDQEIGVPQGAILSCSLVLSWMHFSRRDSTQPNCHLGWVELSWVESRRREMGLQLADDDGRRLPVDPFDDSNMLRIRRQS